MGQLKMSVVETVTYKREMVIDVPTDISDQSLAAILEAHDKSSSSAKEFAENLDGYFGITVVEKPDTSMDSPCSAEIESDFI